MFDKNKIGVHISIAGGIRNAPSRAFELGCETFQCFTRPPQGGPAPIITQEVINDFKKEMERFVFETFYIHTPYYINFASLELRIRNSSIKVVREELERGTLLGAGYVMTHLGSHTGQTLEDGIKKTIDAITETLDGYKGSTKFLMEIAAGTGNIIGDNFEEIGRILEKVKNLSRFGGVCFDTCHAFSSGYDFKTESVVNLMLENFDKKIGKDFLKLSHVNDSKINLGGKKDRHEHIGRGFIGEEGIRNILSTPEFKKIDWIIETENGERKNDIEILKKIRGN